MKKMIFYNPFHNGDIHYSREFVKDIIKKTNYDEYEYHHNNKKLLLDLNLNELHINTKIDVNASILFDGDITYINTWIGQSNMKYVNHMNCTLYSNYQMYREKYDRLNIKYEEMDYYVPSIDYSYYNKKNISIFIEDNKDKKKILISNGLVKSGQAINFNFSKIIERLSNNFPDIIFIATEKFNTTLNNIFFTNDIIKIIPDLNEISYLSTYCDIIIGRSSGPYTFTHVKENLFHKNYIDLSNNESHSLWYGSDKITKTKETKKTYEWLNSNDIERIYNTIKTNINIWL